MRSANEKPRRGEAGAEQKTGVAGQAQQVTSDSKHAGSQGVLRVSAADVLAGLRSAALKYAAHNWPVFPCRPKKVWDEKDGERVMLHSDKSPYVAGGFKSATTDAGQVERWWKQYPGAAIGVPTGPRSKFWVLDIDNKNGVDGFEALEALEAEHGPLPPTLTQQTGSGGQQRFFLWPEGRDIRNSAGDLGVGLDVRGSGGYVIVPPSFNERGQYKWLAKLPLAQAPTWLLDLVVKKPLTHRPGPCPTITATMSTRYGQKVLLDECATLATTPEGQRNDTLNRIAFRLGQLVGGGEIVEAEALQALEAAALASGLEQRRVSATIRSGFSKGLEQPQQASGRYHARY